MPCLVIYFLDRLYILAALNWSKLFRVSQSSSSGTLHCNSYSGIVVFCMILSFRERLCCDSLSWFVVVSKVGSEAAEADIQIHCDDILIAQQLFLVCLIPLAWLPLRSLGAVIMVYTLSAFTALSTSFPLPRVERPITFHDFTSSMRVPKCVSHIVQTPNQDDCLTIEYTSRNTNRTLQTLHKIPNAGSSRKGTTNS